MAVSPHTWVVLGSVHWGPEGGGQGREEGEGAHSSSTCPSSCGGHEDAAGGERVSTHKGEELREAEQGQHLTPHPVQLGMGFGGGWMVESWVVSWTETSWVSWSAEEEAGGSSCPEPCQGWEESC